MNNRVQLFSSHPRICKYRMGSIQVLQNKATKLVLDWATHSSSTQALLGLNWMNLSTRRLMQRSFLRISLLMSVKETVWLLEAQTITATTPAPRKPLDLLHQTRTGFYSDPLHWQTGIPFQKIWDVYLIMLLKFHYSKFKISISSLCVTFFSSSILIFCHFSSVVF